MFYKDIFSENGLLPLGIEGTIVYLPIRLDIKLNPHLKIDLHSSLLNWYLINEYKGYTNEKHLDKARGNLHEIWFRDNLICEQHIRLKTQGMAYPQLI